MMRYVFAKLGAPLLVAALPSCAPSPRPVYPELPPAAVKHPGFNAAARTVDVTPPLHLALFGHGPESRVSTGVRLRLRCQAIVIASEKERVALVPCDLQSSSAALQRAVADKLRARGVPIGPDRLFIMATHTHAAPAHYFEPRRYSGVFSSILSGFDPLVVDHLATQISDAIEQAHSALAPACVAWRQDSVGDANLQLNRAFVPYLANAPLGGPGGEGGSAASPAVIQAALSKNPASPNEPGAEVAVDSLLSVLRIDRRASDALDCDGAHPMAVLAVFGMHPTGLPNTNSLYHGDIFGYATRVAEGKLTREFYGQDIRRNALWDEESAPPRQPPGQSVVVGLANGSDGDVSPRIYEQSETETRRIGRILGDRIAALARSATAFSAQGPIDRLYRELNFSNARYDDVDAHRLCEFGELGSVTGGGARDGPTRLRVIPETNAGFLPDQDDACHGAKLALRNGLPGEHDYPRFGSIAVVRIGEGVLATAPGEMTTMTGLRVRQALAASLEDRTVALAGLTNQYLQYFTTAEEYRFQYYEGASNLYGPHTQTFLVRHFGHLGALLGQRWVPAFPRPHGPLVPTADLPDQPPVNHVQPFHWCDANPQVRRWPDDVRDVRVEAPSRRSVAPRFRSGAWGHELSIGSLPPQFTAVLASNEAPSIPACDAPFEARTGERRYRPLRVEVLESGAVVDDDLGPNLEVREIDTHRWRVRWTPGLQKGDPRCASLYSLRVTVIPEPGKHVVIDSESFPAECGPPPAAPGEGRPR